MLVYDQNNQPIEVSDEDAQKGLLTGQYAVPAGTPIPVKRDNGDIYTIPLSQLPQAVQDGHTLVPHEEYRQWDLQQKYGDIGHELETFGESALDTATLGLYDAAVARASPEHRDRLREMKEANPGSAIAGAVTGAIAPVVMDAFSGGALTPEIAAAEGATDSAGFLAKAAKAISYPTKLVDMVGTGVEDLAKGAIEQVPEATTALGRFGRQVAPTLIKSAAEGAVYNGGATLGEESLQEHPDLSGEKFFHSMAVGSLLGGGLGALGTLPVAGMKYTYSALARKFAGIDQELGQQVSHDIEGAADNWMLRLFGKTPEDAAKIRDELPGGVPALRDELISKGAIDGASDIEKVATKVERLRQASEDVLGQQFANLDGRNIPGPRIAEVEKAIDEALPKGKDSWDWLGPGGIDAEKVKKSLTEVQPQTTVGQSQLPNIKFESGGVPQDVRDKAVRIWKAAQADPAGPSGQAAQAWESFQKQYGARVEPGMRVPHETDFENASWVGLADKLKLMRTKALEIGGSRGVQLMKAHDSVQNLMEGRLMEYAASRWEKQVGGGRTRMVQLPNLGSPSEWSKIRLREIAEQIGSTKRMRVADQWAKEELIASIERAKKPKGLLAQLTGSKNADLYGAVAAAATHHPAVALPMLAKSVVSRTWDKYGKAAMTYGLDKLATLHAVDRNVAHYTMKMDKSIADFFEREMPDVPKGKVGNIDISTFDKKRQEVLEAVAQNSLYNQAVDQHVSMLRAHAPRVAASFQRVAYQTLNYLASTLPRTNTPDSLQPHIVDFEPSDQQKYKWLRAHQLVTKPDTLAEAVRDGTVTRADRDVVANTNPALMQDMTDKYTKGAAAMTKKATAQQDAALRAVLGKSYLSPSHYQSSLQVAPDVEKMPAAPKVSRPLPAGGGPASYMGLTGRSARGRY